VTVKPWRARRGLVLADGLHDPDATGHLLGLVAPLAAGRARHLEREGEAARRLGNHGLGRPPGLTEDIAALETRSDRGGLGAVEPVTRS